jgi:hypothetical protein
MENEWINVTALGSQYEEELEINSGKRRYRLIKLGTIGRYEEKGIGEWQYGSPPNQNQTHDNA